MNLSWFPGHMAKALRQLELRIKQVDLVLEVRDARVPLSSLNPHLEKLVAAKRRLVLLNKADLADPKATRAAATLLSSQAAGLLRVLPCRALDGRSAGHVLDQLLDAMRPCQAPPAASRTSPSLSFAAGSASPLCSSPPPAGSPATPSAPPAAAAAFAPAGASADLSLVLVAGLPNTGKSSLINGLRRAAAARGLLDGDQAWRKTARAGPLPGVTTALGGFRVCRPASASPGSARPGDSSAGQRDGGRRTRHEHVGHVYVLDSPGVLAPALRDMGGRGQQQGLTWPEGGGAGAGAEGGSDGGGGRRSRGRSRGRGRAAGDGGGRSGSGGGGDGGEGTAARLALAGLIPADGRGGVLSEGRVLRHLVQLLLSDPRRLRELWCAADGQVHHMQLRRQQLQREGERERERKLRGGSSSSSRDGSSSNTAGHVRLAQLVYEAVTAPLEELQQRHGTEQGLAWHPALEDEQEEEDAHAAAKGGKGRRNGRHGSSGSSSNSSKISFSAGPFTRKGGASRGDGDGGAFNALVAAAEVAKQDAQLQTQLRERAAVRAAAAATAAAALGAANSTAGSSGGSSSAAPAFAARAEPVGAAEADARVEALLRRLTNSHRGGGGGGGVVDAGRRAAAQRAVLAAFASGALGRYTWDDVPSPPPPAQPVAPATAAAAVPGSASGAAAVALL